jgi:hypothetical protein
MAGRDAALSTCITDGRWIDMLGKRSKKPEARNRKKGFGRGLPGLGEVLAIFEVLSVSFEIKPQRA